MQMVLQQGVQNARASAFYCYLCDGFSVVAAVVAWFMLPSPFLILFTGGCALVLVVSGVWYGSIARRHASLEFIPAPAGLADAGQSPGGSPGRNSEPLQGTEVAVWAQNPALMTGFPFCSLVTRQNLTGPDGCSDKVALKFPRKTAFPDSRTSVPPRKINGLTGLTFKISRSCRCGPVPQSPHRVQAVWLCLCPSHIPCAL
jgi:hypothetical protein